MKTARLPGLCSARGPGIRRSPLSRFLPARLRAPAPGRAGSGPGRLRPPRVSSGPRGGHGRGPSTPAALAEPCAPGKVLRWAARRPAPLQASGCWPCVGEEDAEEEGSERGREPPPSHKQAGVGADAAGWERWPRPVSWARRLLPGAAGLSAGGAAGLEQGRSWPVAAARGARRTRNL